MKFYKDTNGYFVVGNQIIPNGTCRLVFTDTNVKAVSVETDKDVIENTLITSLQKSDGSTYVSLTELLAAVGDFFVKAALVAADSQLLTGLTPAQLPISTATQTALNGKKPYHGIVARPVGVTNPLPSSISTTTFTLSGTTTPVTYYYQGTQVIVNTDKTVQLNGGVSAPAGVYFIYFNAATGNLVADGFPGISDTSNVLIATVTWNGSDYGLVSDERHAYNRDTQWHEWAHDTIGTRYESGIALTHNGGTGAAATFAVTAGSIHDEDIHFVINAQTTGRLFWQTDASTYTFNKVLSSIPGYLGANNRPNVVNSTGYVVTQVTSASDRYVNVFVYAATDLSGSIYFVTETVTNAIALQGGYTSLANARAVGFPNLVASGLSPELKPIYRLIWRADGVLQAITTADDYRNVSSVPQGGGSTSVPTASVIPITTPTGTLAANQQAFDDEIASIFYGRNITPAAYDLDLSLGENFTKTYVNGNVFTLRNPTVGKTFRLFLSGGTVLTTPTFYTPGAVAYTTTWMASTLASDYNGTANVLYCEIRSAGTLNLFWGE